MCCILIGRWQLVLCRRQWLLNFPCGCTLPLFLHHIPLNAFYSPHISKTCDYRFENLGIRNWWSPQQKPVSFPESEAFQSFLGLVYLIEQTFTGCSLYVCSLYVLNFIGDPLVIEKRFQGKSTWTLFLLFLK